MEIPDVHFGLSDVRHVIRWIPLTTTTTVATNNTTVKTNRAMLNQRAVGICEVDNFAAFNSDCKSFRAPIFNIMLMLTFHDFKSKFNMTSATLIDNHDRKV